MLIKNQKLVKKLQSLIYKINSLNTKTQVFLQTLSDDIQDKHLSFRSDKLRQKIIALSRSKKIPLELLIEKYDADFLF